MERKKFYKFYSDYGIDGELISEKEAQKAIFLVCPIAVPKKVVNQWGDEYTEYVECDYALCIFEEDIEKDKKLHESLAKWLRNHSYFKHDNCYYERGQYFEKWYNNK